MPRMPLVVKDRSWMKRAACRGMAPSDGRTERHIFFPERGDMDSVNLAKLICSTCTVQKQCLQYTLWLDSAVAVREGRANRPVGIAAGLSGRARWRLMNARRQRKKAS
jgi:hypothetical protein